MVTPNDSSHPTPPPRNRRLNRRLLAQHGVRAECRRGSLDLGKNIAQAVLDVSEDGIRMVLREAVKTAEEVTLTLSAAAYARPLKRLGSVAWAVSSADGTCCVGVRLHKRLTYAEFTRLVRT
jgi:hypothetical protein